MTHANTIAREQPSQGQDRFISLSDCSTSTEEAVCFPCFQGSNQCDRSGRCNRRQYHVAHCAMYYPHVGHRCGLRPLTTWRSKISVHFVQTNCSVSPEELDAAFFDLGDGAFAD